MTRITQTQRYFPYEFNTKYYSLKFYRQEYSISFVCRRYKISKSSLLRWNKKFNGTKESLINKSHKPLTHHPNAHTPEEIKWIIDLNRRNPNISLCELYGKLRVEKGCSRTAPGLFRFLRKINFFINKENHKKYEPKKYDTPTELGIKW